MTPGDDTKGEKFARLQQMVGQLPEVQGMSTADTMYMSGPLAIVINRILRRGSMTLTAMAVELALTPAEARALANSLVEKGYLQTSEQDVDDEVVYKVRLARTHGRKAPSDIWQALDDL